MVTEIETDRNVNDKLELGGNVEAKVETGGNVNAKIAFGKNVDVKLPGTGDNFKSLDMQGVRYFDGALARVMYNT